MALDLSSLVVEPFERAELFRSAQFCLLDRRFHHLNGLVIDAERHREWMPVLAAMGDGESRRVGEAVRCAVHHLGDHRQRPHGPRPHARNEEELGKVLRAAICGRCQIGAQAAFEHVTWGLHDALA